MRHLALPTAASLALAGCVATIPGLKTEGRHESFTVHANYSTLSRCVLKNLQGRSISRFGRLYYKDNPMRGLATIFSPTNGYLAEFHNNNMQTHMVVYSQARPPHGDVEVLGELRSIAASCEK